MSKGHSMFHLTRVAHFAESSSPVDRAAAADRVRRAAEDAGASRIVIAPTLPGVINGGDLLVHLQFPSDRQHPEATIDSALAAPVVERFHGARYRPGPNAGRKPGASGTVYRALLLRISPGTPAATVEQFERETLQMPRHINSIRAWRLSRVESPLGPTAWTHVWEQEFDELSALEGEYLHHPVHWGVVDRWFDPESTDVIIRDRVCHTFCAIDAPVILPG